MEIKKAKSQQQKLHRVKTILDSAERLYEKNFLELPSAIEIANETGIAKGSLYNYFRTKESIFLTLLERHLQLWVEDIEKGMRQYESVTIEDITHYLTHYWIQNPIFGQLMRISDAILEPKVEAKDLSNYQTRVSNDLKRLTLVFKELNKDIESSQWQKLMKRSTKLILNAWTLSVLSSDKHVDEAKFKKETVELLTPFWRDIIKFKKEVPKEKSGWRKLLG
jgi:AcrR family transcriptional regulator